MKRLSAVAILLVLTLPALAQTRGVPASVTSFGPGRSNTPGVPASVTSLGPHGYSNHGPKYSQSYHSPAPIIYGGYGYGYGNTMCSTPGALVPSAMGCTNASFTNQYYGLPVTATNTNLGRGRGHRQPNGVYYPVYVPYAVPVVVEGDQPPPTEAVPPEDETMEPPALTVFEHRPTISAPTTSAPAVNEARVYRPAPNGEVPPAAAERTAPAIVLVYKDGHQREVQNYAIVGNYIYDMGGFVAQKIPLSDLNLKATVKANDELGTDFTLPAGVTP